MKRPPAKKAVVASRIRFYKTIIVLLCLSGGLYWLGWKSSWARLPAAVNIQTPDLPKSISAAHSSNQNSAAGNAVTPLRNDALRNNIKEYGNKHSAQGN
jgi:hypothetical protein